jgi:hypothetical protein
MIGLDFAGSCRHGQVPLQRLHPRLSATSSVDGSPDITCRCHQQQPSKAPVDLSPAPCRAARPRRRPLAHWTRRPPASAAPRPRGRRRGRQTGLTADPAQSSVGVDELKWAGVFVGQCWVGQECGVGGRVRLTGRRGGHRSKQAVARSQYGSMHGSCAPTHATVRVIPPRKHKSAEQIAPQGNQAV